MSKDKGSSALEILSINPVIGSGHTTAPDVQRELHSYQKFTRAAARDSGGRLAIFQANFLLVVQDPQKPLVLHRVANGLWYDDATASDLNFYYC